MKEIWFLYEDSNIYDGYYAEVYTDGTFMFRDHWAVNRLTNEQLAKLSGEIMEVIHKAQKEKDEIN